MTEQLYKQAQQAQQGQSAQGDAQSAQAEKKEDVVDADYKVVNEDENK